MPTQTELRAQARSLGLKVGGTKAELTSRIATHFQVEGNAEQTISGFEPGRAPRAESVATTITEASETGGSVAAAAKKATVLTEGNALAAVMPPYRAKIHAMTFQSLQLLDRLPNPEPDTVSDPETLFEIMAPVCQMTALMADAKGNINASENHGANLRDLLANLRMECSKKAIFTTKVKPEVAAFLQPFLGDVTPVALSALPPGQIFQFGYVDRTGEAIEASLLEAAEKYKATDDPDPEFPSNQAIDDVVSATGSSFWRLLRKLKLPGVSHKFMENFHHHIIAEKLFYFDVYAKRFIRIPEPEDRLATDAEVRAAMPQDGSAITTTDLEKALSIEDSPPEDRYTFIIDVSIRGVVLESELGTTVNETSWVLNPAGTVDGKAAEQESSALASALSRVKLACQDFIRDWRGTFPEPTVFHWPADFSKEEKKLINAVLKTVCEDTSRKLVSTTVATKAADTDAAVTHILGFKDFPVPRALTTSVIRAALAQLIPNLRSALKAKEKVKKDAFDAAAAAAPGGKRKRVVEDDDDDGDDGVAPAGGAAEDEAGMDIDVEAEAAEDVEADEQGNEQPVRKKGKTTSTGSTRKTRSQD